MYGCVSIEAFARSRSHRSPVAISVMVAAMLRLKSRPPAGRAPTVGTQIQEILGKQPAVSSVLPACPATYVFRW